MNRKILFILLVTLVVLIGIQQSVANGFIHGKFKEQYDVSGTKLDSCKLCMASTSPPVSRNEYGMDLRNDSDFNRNNPLQAMKNIESLDSDGDGFINIDEITSSTFPGNASDFPAGPSPELISAPHEEPTKTPTKTPAQTPVQEDTEPKSTNAVTAFATLSMFVAVYFLIVRKKEE